MFQLFILYNLDFISDGNSFLTPISLSQQRLAAFLSSVENEGLDNDIIEKKLNVFVEKD
jgi:hypothetical protein